MYLARSEGKNKKAHLREYSGYLQRDKGGEKEEEMIGGEMDLLTWGVEFFLIYHHECVVVSPWCEVPRYEQAYPRR